MLVAPRCELTQVLREGGGTGDAGIAVRGAGLGWFLS